MRAILTGFSGSGKTTVGRLVASSLGDLPWVDLDEAIALRAGRTIERIFAESGEAEFRRIEREVALEVLGRPGPLVVSTGGGTLADPEVGRAARGTLCVALFVRVDTAIERMEAGGGVRPLLAGPDPRARARELHAARSGLYASADAAVQTDGRTPEAVTAEVCAIVRGEAVPVPLGERGYPVYVGSGLLATVPRLVTDAGLGTRAAAIVLDRAIARRHGGELCRSLGRSHRRLVRVLSAGGDRHKTLRTASRVLDKVLGGEFERSCPVLALGGGVVTDLGGFVAATLLRGVPFVPLPTTLLAQSDASVGGKVGVNHPSGKNLIGAFHQPRLVVADLDTLRTLPRRQLANGLAEVVKCGVIRDEVILELLERRAEAVLAGDPESLWEPLKRAIAVKARIVARDEREAGERRALNFGHTVGHALEAAARYEGLLHGEAVAIGMAVALRMGQARGVTPPGLVQRTVRLLRRFGLPVDAPPELARKASGPLCHDKKAKGGRIRLVLAAGDGRTEELPIGSEDLAREAFFG